MRNVRATIAIGTVMGLLAMLFAYFGGPSGPRRPVFLLPILGIIVVGGVFTWIGTDVCVIEPGRVGYGRHGRHLYWVDRQRIGSIRINKRLLL